MTVQQQIPGDALVLDRCNGCGSLISDNMVRSRERKNRLCDNCNGSKLPQPWERESYYEDEEAEPAPECSCGRSEFTMTFERPNGERIEHEVDSGDWCEDHAVFHIEYEYLVPNHTDDEDDPVLRRSRCRCGRDAYLPFDWEA